MKYQTNAKKLISNEMSLRWKSYAAVMDTLMMY